MLWTSHLTIGFVYPQNINLVQKHFQLTLIRMNDRYTEKVQCLCTFTKCHIWIALFLCTCWILFLRKSHHTSGVERLHNTNSIIDIIGLIMPFDCGKQISVVPIRRENKNKKKIRHSCCISHEKKECISRTRNYPKESRDVLLYTQWLIAVRLGVKIVRWHITSI